MKDYYKILGVNPGCEQTEVKKAYRLLAVQLHPDKNGGDKKSEDRFKEIAEAYSVLSDATSRNEYDYIKGYKTSYRNGHINSEGHSPVKFLIHIQSIKTRVLQNGGRLNQHQVYTLVDKFLSDKNIDYLLRAGDLATNGLIVDQVLTCSIFFDRNQKEAIYTKLLRLQANTHVFAEKVKLIEKDLTDPSLLYTKPYNKASSEPVDHVFATIIFIVFILMFTLLTVRWLFK